MLVGSVQWSKAFRHVWWTSALSRVRSICRLIKYPVSKFSYPRRGKGQTAAASRWQDSRSLCDRDNDISSFRIKNESCS
jgi:hypothetical protein